jgi:type II secretory pathway component HofQ
MKHHLLSLFLFALPLAGNATDSKPVDPPKTISVDFPEKDVREILRAIADAFELNVVIPDTLNGRASIKLRDVTWEQAFKVILEPVGWVYDIDGIIIKIRPKKPESIVKESDPSEMLSMVGAMQSSVAKSLLRDKDLAEAVAEFYWNLYSALLAKGFSKEEAMKIVVAASASESVSNQ